MTKQQGEGILPTQVYTYEVKMIIQIFAENEKEAKERLDNQGGYVTKREVTLKDSIALFNGSEKGK